MKVSSILEFFLNKNVKVYAAGVKVSGKLKAFSGNQKKPHSPAVLILETKRGPIIVRGNWLKITGD